MVHEHALAMLQVLLKWYPHATLREVVVCLSFESMVSQGHAPTLSELSKSSGASISSVSRWLDKYQSEGLLVAHRDPDDQRALRIHQTARGRAFKAQLGKELAAAMASSNVEIASRLGASLTPHRNPLS